MKLGVKIGMGYFLMIALVIVCGASGIYGLYQFSQTLDYIVGPAWGSADSAMESKIEIQNQVMLVNRIVSGIDIVETQTRLNEAIQTADDEITTMASFGIVPEQMMTTFQSNYADYISSLDQLLASYRTYKDIQDTFDSQTDEYVMFYLEVDEVGDGAVFALENEPTKRISWNDGLKNRWLAADGGMESNIGYLQQLYYLESLRRGADVKQTEENIAAAIALQEEAIEEMLSTGLFDVPSQSDPNLTVAERLGELQQSYKSVYAQLVEAIKQLRLSMDRYLNAEETLLTYMDDVQEIGESAIVEEVGKSATIKKFVNTVIWSVLVMSVLVGVLIGYLITRSVMKPIQECVAFAQNISRGDLTGSVEVKSNDETGLLCNTLNEMSFQLNQLIHSMQSTIEIIGSSAQELSKSAQSVSCSATEQASSIEETSASVEELAASIEQSAANADGTEMLVVKASDFSSQAFEKAQLGVEQVQTMNFTMVEIQESSEEISKIIKVIDDIADQTNLLALNAAIEAARAGEAGKGFAVVADEVRKLAERSSIAAKDITTKIQDSINKVEEGSQFANRSVKGLSSIQETSEQVKQGLLDARERVNEITQVCRQQADGTNQIRQAIIQIEQAAQMNASTSEETASASDALNSQAQMLAEQISRFKINHTHENGVQSLPHY